MFGGGKKPTPIVNKHATIPAIPNDQMPNFPNGTTNGRLTLGFL